MGRKDPYLPHLLKLLPHTFILFLVLGAPCGPVEDSSPWKEVCGVEPWTLSTQ